MGVMCGLLSGGFGLVFDKVNIADPELTIFSVRLLVDLWGIKGDFISQ